MQREIRLYTKEHEWESSIALLSGNFGNNSYWELWEKLNYDFRVEQGEIDEAAAWCETASAGEEYEGSNFYIVITEKEQNVFLHGKDDAISGNAESRGLLGAYSFYLR